NDAPAALTQTFGVRGVGDAHIGAEPIGGALHDRDMLLVQQSHHEIAVGLDALAAGAGAPDAACDVWEDIERTFGRAAMHARRLIQHADNEVTPLAIGLRPRAQKILRPIERRRRSRLADRGNTAGRLSLNVQHGVDQWFWPAGITDTP